MARREAHQQRKRLRSAQRFAGGPLRESSTEDLRAGAFGQHFDAEAVKHFVAAFVETEIGGAQLREMRAERLGAHAGAVNVGAHPAEQRGARRLQRAVGDGGQRGVVFGLLAAVDVPVRVGLGMRFGPSSDSIKQNAHAIFRIDASVVRTMRAQFAEERRVIGGDALADYGHSEARRGGRRGRNGGAQAVGVRDGRGPKGIELVRGPEMRGKLLDKLCRRVDPIKIFESSGKMDLRKALQPVVQLIRGERI